MLRSSKILMLCEDVSNLPTEIVPDIIVGDKALLSEYHVEYLREHHEELLRRLIMDERVLSHREHTLQPGHYSVFTALVDRGWMVASGSTFFVDFLGYAPGHEHSLVCVRCLAAPCLLASDIVSYVRFAQSVRKTMCFAWVSNSVVSTACIRFASVRSTQK